MEGGTSKYVYGDRQGDVGLEIDGMAKQQSID